jgi:hypothetical protein
MANKDSEAIQKEIADFTAKLQAGAPKKAGQKSTKGAKKELPKGKKGAPLMKQVSVPISSFEVEPVAKFEDFVALVKKANFTAEHIGGFTPVDKGDADYGKIFPIEDFAKMVVPDKYMPPEMKEYAFDVGLVAYALLKPDWAKEIACVSTDEGVKTVLLADYAHYFDSKWGNAVSKALAKEMDKAMEIIGAGEPVTDSAGTSDEAITAFIKTLPVSLDYEQVEHNVLKKFPLLIPPGTALTTLIKNVMQSMQPKDEEDKTITDFILGLPDGLDEMGRGS